MRDGGPSRILGIMRTRIFFGWWVVAVSMAIMSMGMGPFGIAAFGVFMLPFQQEFGWDRAQVSLSLSLLVAASGIGLVIIGRMLDRFGPRRILIFSNLALAVLLIAVPTFVSQLWHLQALYFLMGAASAGTNVLTYMPVLASWFHKHRGLAIGLAVSGIGVGYTFVPVLVQSLIDAYGWRGAYYGLAAIVLFIAVPLAWFGIIETPARKGLYPDGNAGLTPAASRPDVGLTAAEAFRTREFWLMLVIFFSLTFATYGAFAHFVPMLVDRKLSPQAAASAASLTGFTVFGARVLVGLLVDRFFAPRVAMVIMVLALAGMLILALGLTGAPIYAAAILLGLAIGAESDLLAYLNSRYFGLRAIGGIFGLQSAAYMGGTALGPILYGIAYVHTGSYVTILYTAIGVVIFAITLTAFLRPFPTWEHPAQETSTAPTAS